MVATWLTELYLDQINRALLESRHVSTPAAAPASGGGSAASPAASLASGGRSGGGRSPTKKGAKVQNGAPPTVAELEKQLQVRLRLGPPHVSFTCSAAWRAMVLRSDAP